MKRSVEPDFEFNKERFAEMLKEAIGTRSISQFGKDASLSFSYLSKYMNKREEKTPTIQTIKKIAIASYGPDFKMLLEAAGYDSQKYAEGDFGGEVTISAWSLLRTVLPSLYLSPLKWTISEAGEDEGGFLSSIVENAPFSRWFFIPVTKESLSKEDVMDFLSDSRAGVISVDSKVTFITSNRNVYEQLAEIELPLISLRLSAALVDIYSGTIVGERYIHTAITLSDNDWRNTLSKQRARNIDMFTV